MFTKLKAQDILLYTHFFPSPIPTPGQGSKVDTFFNTSDISSILDISFNPVTCTSLSSINTYNKYYKLIIKKGEFDLDIHKLHIH